MNIWNFSS